MAATSAAKNRAIRQDNLREWLSKKCSAQHLINNIEKIEELDPSSETFTNELAKLKVANEQRLKVLAKYLPDLKRTEIAGPDEEKLTVNVVKFGLDAFYEDIEQADKAK